VSSLEALFLGLVQGLTEFLPVSSSGHLVIFSTLLGLEPDGGLLFEVAVHVATLLAIAIYFRVKILELTLGVFRRDAPALRYVGKLIVATLPAVAVALVFKERITEVLSSPLIAAGGLLVTGAILWTTRATLETADQSEPSLSGAFLIGVAQAFAILPGVSRSGSTVAVALALGVAPAAAAEFSFLLGIIAITGAAVLTLPDLAAASPETVTTLALGCAAALGSGILAIWMFVAVLRNKRFYQFAYYTLTVGVLFGLFVLFG
jgi:undecaprenyl-diphosphatase